MRRPSRNLVIPCACARTPWRAGTPCPGRPPRPQTAPWAGCPTGCAPPAHHHHHHHHAAPHFGGGGVGGWLKGACAPHLRARAPCCGAGGTGPPRRRTHRQVHVLLLDGAQVVLPPRPVRDEPLVPARRPTEVEGNHGVHDVHLLLRLAGPPAAPRLALSLSTLIPLPHPQPPAPVLAEQLLEVLPGLALGLALCLGLPLTLLALAPLQVVLVRLPAAQVRHPAPH